MLCKTRYLTKLGTVKIITKRLSKFPSRICLNSFVTYKEQLPTGCKSIFTSNYTIQIHNALCEEEQQEKKRATGTSGTKKWRN